MAHTLRIAIDCRITNSRQGIGTAILALAKAFSDSALTDQHYTFIVREGMQDWLRPYIYGPCSLEAVTEAAPVSILKTALRQIPPLRFLWRALRSRVASIPTSDGYVESRQFDVVHFPTQLAYLTRLPSIYQPHDLQHIHLPAYFSKAEFARRERTYRAFCAQAAFVCVHAEWTKQDIVKQYGLSPDKVAVIKWGPVFDAYPAPSDSIRKSTISKYGLPNQFYFFPAVTWPHKNHECILRALRILRDEYGKLPSVVCTGESTNFRRTLDRIARQLKVSEQIRYLGFVTPEELQAIYGEATAMIYPSRFEGFGLPVLEAFHAGVPILCSNATVLPEIAQGGALYFRPDSPAELAVHMNRMLVDHRERERLIKQGKQVLSQYSFHDTANHFRALYEQAAASPRDIHHLLISPTVRA